ncbi:MAG: S8 family serine peptidase, partial [Bacteroidota bacterium]
RIAAQKGVLLVTAMGNEGNYRDPRTRTTGTLIAPADADSIVAVGAISADGFLAGFSSTGPTADGRVKPEVVAQGVNVYAVSGESSYGYWGGTSLSTPLTAGAAALILSANLSLTPMEVRARLIGTTREFNDSTSRTQSYPNNYYGWGMVDAAKAVGLSGESPIPDRFVLHNNYPNPFNGTTTIIVDAPSAQVIEVAIYTVLGQRVRTLFKGYSTLGENRFFWRDGLDEKGDRVASGVYICRLQTPTSITSTKVLFIK